MAAVANPASASALVEFPTEGDRANDQGLMAEADKEEGTRFTGKKKKKKEKKEAHPAREDDDDEAGLPEEPQSNGIPEVDGVIQFSGKKKSKKGKKVSSASKDHDTDFNQVNFDSDSVARVESSSFSKLTEEAGVIPEAEEEDVAQSKKGKKGSTTMGLWGDENIASLIELEDAEAETAVGVDPVHNNEALSSTVLPKVKQKKGKKTGRSAQEEEDLDAILAELDGLGGQARATEAVPVVETTSVQGSTPVEAVMELEEPVESANAKKKKKKKEKEKAKSKAAEDDLDAILAELDGLPARCAEAVPTSAQDAVPKDAPASGTLSGPVEAAVAAEEAVESAAAKKKKRRKEKEKAKAAEGEKQTEAVEEGKGGKDLKQETKAKVPDKKLPKHVREMQERLARMKELEEKRLREEEEKRRKEEEEIARLEELERQKEEAKRRRKEREKEKLLQKKKEGKFLNEKQKAEQRRLAAMREQFIAKTGNFLGVDDVEEVASKPKPKYGNNRKRRPGLGAAEVESNAVVEEEIKVAETPEAVEPTVEKQVEPEESVGEEVGEEEEDEDWDAKSWEQDVALPVIKTAFAEEEEVESPANGKLMRSLSTPPPKAVASTVKQVMPRERNGEVESDSEGETSSDDDDADVKRRRDVKAKREARKAEALTKRSADDLRSPICCILGHVDTGKTKLLDCIRRTNVQEGEAGGITQQIGATYFPMENIRERTKELNSQAKLRVPGLLVIDTPGHESFTNLRARGSSLCDIAILVIDIMHGLEPQTIESLNLLKMRKTPFIVALNKVDRLYDWKTCPNAPIKDAMGKQSKDVSAEFEMRLSQIVTQLKEQGLNSELYYKNKEIRKVISIVPTSAISGEGVPDILMLLVQLTQKMMEDKLMYISEIQCTVLEVKVVEGLGTTIDVILVNGVLHEGDQIVVCGMQGPIVTSIRALLTPHPMKELRVKGTYQHHKELKAAQGIKITAQGLEHAIAGTQLYVVGPDDDLEDVKEEAMQDMKTVMSRVDKSGEGVCVQASTLGSLEALLEFLKSPAVKIPVSGIGIGPVHKRDVMRASVMLERKKKEYATILAFDVKVTPEAKELAEEYGVRIFMADIIYHLFDQFTAFMNSVKEEKRKESAEEAVFPCVLQILPNCVFNKKDPIVVGVMVQEGIAKVGTPICVPSREFIDIGKIASIEVNHKDVDTAKKGQSVAMKIVGTNAEEMQKMVGRHFMPEDQLVSRLTRTSIDLLKEHYRDDLSNEDWRLVVHLKKLFEIP